MKARIFLSLCAVSIALVGCSQETETPAEPDAVVTPVADDADYDFAQPGAGNEYSYLDLLALRDGDGKVMTEAMQNIGGCTFEDGEGRELLLVGTPDDRNFRAIGVARPNGKGARKFEARSPGDDYVWEGPVMVHDGAGTMDPLTLTVRRAAGEARSVGVETREWDAELLVSDPNGERRPYAGTWSCGV